MVVGEHGTQKFKVMVVVFSIVLLSFDVFVFIIAYPYLCLDMGFVQMY